MGKQITIFDMNLSNDTKIAQCQAVIRKHIMMPVTDLDMVRKSKKVLAELYRRKEAEDGKTA